MYLIYCKECKSTFSMSNDIKRCDCGKSWGCKVGFQSWEYGGPSVPVSFNQRGLDMSIKNQSSYGDGTPFFAYVLGVETKNIKRKIT